MSSRNAQLPSTAAGIVVRFKLLLLLSLLDSRKGGESFVESCSTLLVRERTKRTKRKRSKHDIIASIKMKIGEAFRFRCMHCTIWALWYRGGFFERKSKIKIDRYVCSMLYLIGESKTPHHIPHHKHTPVKHNHYEVCQCHTKRYRRRR